MERQMSLIVPTIDELVASDHPYRQLLKLLDFGELTRGLKDLYSELGRGGYPIEQGFRCLLLQYVEDLSDREMERCLQENLAAKLFCGFELLDQTPEFSCFSRLRSRIGLAELTKLFNRVRKSLKVLGLIREVFTFVDSSQLLSRVDLWESRDLALADRKNAELLTVGHRLLSQKRDDHHKLYSLHAPEVECFAKGKAGKKYEFGSKGSLVTTSWECFVVGMKSFAGTPYDGHTLEEAMALQKRLGGFQAKEIDVDRGYRGRSYHGSGIVHVVGQSWKGLTTSQRGWYKRRSGIEAVIGHAKTDGHWDGTICLESRVIKLTPF
jgi:transposase